MAASSGRDPRDRRARRARAGRLGPPAAPARGASWRDQPESGVGVAVVGLEPVAERAPEERQRGACGSALQDEVPALKEVRRVARIEGEGHEAGERAERSGRPLPAVPQGVGDAEGARALREGADWRRIPSPAAEIAVAGRGIGVAPGIDPFLTAAACRTPRDGTRPRWARIAEPSAHRPWLRHGSRRPASRRRAASR